MSHGFTTVAQDEQDQRRQNEVIRGLMDGKSNNTGEVTLTENVATTVVVDLRVGAESVIMFVPTTLNAAAEQAAGGMYVSSRGKQTFTITHANNAQTDRDFVYAVIG
ncbi:MAG: hypothetical protein KAS66_05315 [Candidatus Omnitrophica bacterium]|nr:hypothetical protein [Candidatus Omnitrophota bacterium]